MKIRLATTDDAAAIRKIYEPYVLNTAITFEYEVPTVEEFERRIRNTLEEYPYLVAIENDEIVGYAYASQFHPRAAYKHSAELSIYIDKDSRKSGIGKSLYLELIEILKRQNVYTLHACVAYADRPDEHLTNDSVAFHEKMGFTVVGKHTDCGYKFGRWYSMVWMDMKISADLEKVDTFIPFLSVDYSTRYGII